MKRFIFVLSFIIYHLSLHAQWDVLNEGLTGEFNYFQRPHIQFISEDIGWIIFPDITYKTLDEGETWIPDLIEENWRLTKVKSSNDSIESS
jgi:hypothetical protein